MTISCRPPLRIPIVGSGHLMGLESSGFINNHKSPNYCYYAIVCRAKSVLGSHPNTPPVVHMAGFASSHELIADMLRHSSFITRGTHCSSWPELDREMSL